MHSVLRINFDRLATLNTVNFELRIRTVSTIACRGVAGPVVLYLYFILTSESNKILQQIIILVTIR